MVCVGNETGIETERENGIGEVVSSTLLFSCRYLGALSRGDMEPPTLQNAEKESRGAQELQHQAGSMKSARSNSN
jgi:hypothetical protein